MARIIARIVIEDEPKPAPRPRINKKTGGVFFPSGYRDYLKHYGEKVRRAWGRWPIQGNVGLRIRFYRSTRRRVDIDNLEDDALIIAKESTLCLGDPDPRTEIEIFETEGADGS